MRASCKGQENQMAPASCDDFQTFATLLLDHLLRLWGPLIHLEIPAKIRPATDGPGLAILATCVTSPLLIVGNTRDRFIFFLWYRSGLADLKRRFADFEGSWLVWPRPEVFVESMCRRLIGKYTAYTVYDDINYWEQLAILHSLQTWKRRAKLGQSCYDCIDGSNMAIPNR